MTPDAATAEKIALVLHTLDCVQLRLSAIERLLSESRPSPDIDPDELLSIDGAAKVMGLSRVSVLHLIGEGRLPEVRVGRRRLVSRAAIRELAAKGVTP